MLNLEPYIDYNIGMRFFFNLPRNVVDAYTTALTLNNIVYDRLQLLENHPIPTPIKKKLNYLKTFYEKEQHLFTALLNYELNLQAQHFYDSMGMVINEDSISAEQIITCNRLLMKDLNYINNQITLLDQLMSRTAKDFDTVFAAWLDLRDSMSILYRKLARLYPYGSIRDAIIEIANTLDENQDSIILSNILFGQSL